MSNRGDIYLSDWLVRKRRSFKRDQEQRLQSLAKNIANNGNQQSFFNNRIN